MRPMRPMQSIQSMRPVRPVRPLRRALNIIVCLTSLAGIVLISACSPQATVTVEATRGGPGGPGGQGGPGGPGGPGGSGGSGTPTTPSATGFTSSSSPIAKSSALAALDLTALPVGDNRTTTSAPQANKLYVCTAATQGTGGASHEGPWFNGNGTYNLASKVNATGNITWNDPQFSVTVNGNTRVVHTNGLPSAPTGIFPILSNTTAYQYDRNPNSITAQNITLNLPANPTAAAKSGCMRGGTIGVMLNGGALFDSVDAAGRDAVAHEVQDGCWGHPQQDGVYHYHSLTPCMNFGTLGAGTSPLIGYALDGYGIYGPFQDGKLVTNAQLDACHGMTSSVQWDGQTVTMYHYVANFEFPYTVGCYHGTPVQTGGPQG